ncbi:MAG: type II secretion system minor pseudopilin GspI [Gammaproteobacteria bacterium]
MENKPRPQAHGFTLIEVLVALVILAIALPAIIKATSDSINSTAYLRDKTVAHWVALNTIARLQLGTLPMPASEGEQGKEQQFGKNYYWQMIIDNAEDPYVLRIAVEVSTTPKGRALDHVIGFVRRQPSPGQ